MSTIVGRRKTAMEQRNAPKLPPIRNRYDFWYLADPWAWEFNTDDLADGHSGWLPRLGRMNLIPGVGGIGPQGQVDGAILARQREGWQVIRPDDHRLGEYMNYTQRLPSRGKTPVWASIFESVKMVGRRPVWADDDDAFRRFRRYLVDSGIVPDITDEVRDGLIDEIENRLEQHRGRLIANPNNPALARRIEATEKRIQTMRGIAPEPPKPKRTRRAKS